jgi:hypothetical protein
MDAQSVTSHSETGETAASPVARDGHRRKPDQQSFDGVIAELAAWLLADDGPIAEDERIARAAVSPPWRHDKEAAYGNDRTVFGSRRDRADLLHVVARFDGAWNATRNAEHIMRWDPARVLAECAAKRRIVEGYRLHDPASRTDVAVALAYTMQTLAQVYADRPGWRDEWTTS